MVVVRDVDADWKLNVTTWVPNPGRVPFDADVYARKLPPFAGAVDVADWA